MAQLRICLLNPTEDITALKLRGWLQAEAAKIDDQDSKDDHILLRLFLAKRVRYGFTPQKLDALLQGIVDKYPNIESIQLVEVEHPLTLDQMREEAEIAQEELNEMGSSLDDDFDPVAEGLVRYFGYSTEGGEDESPFDIPEQGMVCMVSNIIERNREPVSQQTGRDFVVGQWFVSEGGCDTVVVHGPFEAETEALDFAAKQCKAIRFKTEAVFHPA